MEFRELSVISRNSDQISWKLQAKITDLLRFQQKSPKMRKFHENFAKFCENLQNSRNPFCESCRSRKIWKNEYLDAKIGVDTAENELCKVWMWAPQQRRASSHRGGAETHARCLDANSAGYRSVKIRLKNILKIKTYIKSKLNEN